MTLTIMSDLTICFHLFKESVSCFFSILPKLNPLVCKILSKHAKVTKSFPRNHTFHSFIREITHFIL